jgi:hypothetical protein
VSKHNAVLPLRFKRRRKNDDPERQSIGTVEVAAEPGGIRPAVAINLQNRRLVPRINRRI